jgi:hypothetical protein
LDSIACLKSLPSWPDCEDSVQHDEARVDHELQQENHPIGCILPCRSSRDLRIKVASAITVVGCCAPSVHRPYYDFASTIRTIINEFSLTASFQSKPLLRSIPSLRLLNIFWVIGIVIWSHAAQCSRKKRVMVAMKSGPSDWWRAPQIAAGIWKHHDNTAKVWKIRTSRPGSRSHIVGDLIAPASSWLDMVVVVLVNAG